MKTKAKGVIETWLRKDNTSRVCGVFYRKAHLKWYARIQYRGKLYLLGGHDSYHDAVVSRLNKEIELFGGTKSHYNLYRLYEIEMEDNNETL